MLVLFGGFLALDRLGRKQIDLARQQPGLRLRGQSRAQDAPDLDPHVRRDAARGLGRRGDARQTYYAFISDESERLTRLINNVLQLARLTRNELRIEPKPVTVRS